MKITKQTAGLCFIISMSLCAAEESLTEAIVQHREGSNEVADKQDELAADVQQLTVEQTIPEVIKLLSEVETIMDEATDQLAKYDTGGRTIAAQTEIIEKIHAAAKEKKRQQGSGKSGDAMMEMMERMMGKKPESDQEGQGKKPGNKAGQGQSGLPDTTNELDLGNSTGKSEARRIPKASGNQNVIIPEEFRKALDAYNRGAEQKVK